MDIYKDVEKMKSVVKEGIKKIFTEPEYRVERTITNNNGSYGCIIEFLVQLPDFYLQEIKKFIGENLESVYIKDYDATLYYNSLNFSYDVEYIASDLKFAKEKCKRIIENHFGMIEEVKKN